MRSVSPTAASGAAAVVVLLGALLADGAADRAEVAVESYRIAVTLQPDRAALSARARVRLRALRRIEGAVTCFLNERLRLIDGGVRTGGSRRRPFAPAGAPVELPLDGPVAAGAVVEVELAYEGSLAGSTASLYGISTSLTELSAYGAWFPAFEGTEQYPYEMEITTPASQEVVSNGRRAGEEVHEGRRVVRFEGTTAARDLVVVASNALRTVETPDGPVIAHLDLDQGQVEALAADLAWILEFYGRHLAAAPPGAGSPVIVAALPRGGGSYARPPLIVLDASRPELWAASPRAREDQFHRLAHEAAHLLWPWADSASADDWLNEGLAEYCALLASSARFGEGRERELVRGYRRRVLSPAESRPIARTLRTDPWAEALFYDKGALILRMLEDRLALTAARGDGRPLESVLREYRRLELPTTGDLERLAAGAAGAPLDGFFDTWIRSTAAPRVWLALRRAEPAGPVLGAESLRLAGDVLADRDLPPGTPVTVAALSGDRRHDVRVAAGPGATRFETVVPFLPDRVVVDPDLLLLQEEDVFREDLLRSARVGRAEALVADAQEAEERGQNGVALDLYLRAADLAPEDLLPPYRAGRACAALGDHRRALALHDRAGRLAGGHPELRSWNQVRIGEALLALGRRREARGAFSEALRLPDFAGSHEAALQGLARRRE